ncbi:protein-glutamate O-methyltransferase CheR [Methylobacterium sp. SD21]|uniref:CheR family methyltransferase n=1 Tax=Methylobacterium litchii TaxID=3138810 RepID=UPI00313ADD94
MRRPGKPRPDPAVEPAYAALKARIIARTGHAYYSDKDDLLLERLYRRMRATGAPDLAGFAALLDEPTQGEAEWARLEAEITIGETFFFRYSEQFTALRGTILPDLVDFRRSEKRLRIWSAGCSTGAEPYSLAILVREILGEALPEWRVTILGTDISAEAIATARAAEYGRWALRTMPPEERLRYFTHLPPEPGLRREGGFALRPEFRAMVRFTQGNLLKVAEPPGGGEEGYDLILCRNVLIYFDAATVTRVVHGLGRRLRPEGWLLLGHAEPNPTFSAFLDPVSLPGTVAYRPGGRLSPEPVPPVPFILPELPVLASVERAVEVSKPILEPSFEAADAAPQDEVEGETEEGNEDAAPLDRVRILADAGETGAAWRVLREALDADPTHAGLRFYEGLVAVSLGREAEAERALRAALYLDRHFVMAHYHLGLLLLGLGRRVEAVRALDNAFALSQSLPPDTVLPEGDGALARDVAAGVSAALGRSFETMRGRA